MPARQGKSEEKIKSHINTPEQYKYYLDNNCEDKESLFYVSKKQYVDFLKAFFDEVIEAMVYHNKEIKLPFKMGMICIRRYEQKVKMVDGKIINNLPVNWNATLKLWESDPEAKEKKQLVRHRNKNRLLYKFVYYRSKAGYKNKNYYWFKPTRTNKQKLKTAINKGQIEVYNLF